MKKWNVVAALLYSGVVHGQDGGLPLRSERVEAAISHMRGRYEAMTLVPKSDMWSPATIWSSGTEPYSEPVSVARLQHRVPKAARKAFDRAIKFSGKGDWSKAASELEAAVSLDPEYAEAHSELGLVYFRLGRMEHAAAELRRAIAMEPNASLWHSNLGWALFELRDFGGAQESARNALRLSPYNDRAHVLMGILLGAAPETRREGIRHLEQAAGAFPGVADLLNQLKKAEIQ